MIKVEVQNRQGTKVDEVEIDPAEFGGAVNKQLLHDAVLMYLANRRAGTHSTKRRGEVAGSTRKLFRQKGTGRARVGNIRTNKRRGGGTSKGPKPRDYYYRLPKKAVRKATRMAMLSKLKDSEVIIIDDISLDEIKTKQVVEILGNLKLENTTCLIGTDEYDQTLYKSARNIPGIEVMPVSQWNAYMILRPKRVILTVKALEELRNPQSGNGQEEQEESKTEE